MGIKNKVQTGISKLSSTILCQPDPDHSSSHLGPPPLITDQSPVWEEDWSEGWMERWNIVEASGGFGNNELQTYTSSPTNVSSYPTQAGNQLKLNAVVNGQAAARPCYTSAKLMSRRSLGSESFYIEFALPHGVPWSKGIWPAIWLLPFGFECQWPTGGEIDILEVFGPQPLTDLFEMLKNNKPSLAMCAHWTEHHLQYGHSRSDHQLLTASMPFSIGLAASGYSLTWYVNHVPVKSTTVPALGAGMGGSGFASLAQFQVILNIAIGGTATQHQVPKPGEYYLWIGSIKMYRDPPGGWGAFGQHHATEQQAGRYH